MPMLCYVEKRFSASSLALIGQANAIIDEYLQQGFRLTLRQLYYQFVARDWIENSQRSYKRLGSVVSDGRNAGLVDWNAIEDRTRNVRTLPHWDCPSEILRMCAEQFRFDLWERQDYRPEVWIEKDALIGVFESVCQELDVPLFSCRGYTSLSEVWAAGRRFAGHLRNAQTPVVLHFGDHDPSGMDMTRDILDRLELYAEDEVQVRRLALNMEQVNEYGPPPNPAKVTDSRYTQYVSLYKNESWELDALEPTVLAGLARDAILRYRDEGQWCKDEKRQDAARKRLAALADEWGK